MKWVTREHPKTDPHRLSVADPEVHRSGGRDRLTISVFEVDRATIVASIPVPGRTRWTVFDPSADVFFVNIADPPWIVVIEGADPARVSRTIEIAAAGPHGLEVDEAGRLYCACDAGRLLELDPPAYDVVADLPLACTPDVIFLDPILRRVYVAIGDSGLTKVFDVDRLERVDGVGTEQGPHTIAIDVDQHRVYALVPGSHHAAVFVDNP